LIDKVGLSERDAILAGGMANGSVGKALSIDIKSLLKTREEIKRIIENLTIPDHSRAEKVINSAEFFVKAGEEGLVILQTLLRDIAVLKVNGGQMINRDIEDELKAKASKWSIEETVQKFEAVVEALDKLNRNVNKSLVYESLALALAD
jgi:DNA polymerase III gamma/tau subunit